MDAEFYHTLFKKAPIGLALCKLTGELVAVNEAYADILGRTVDETLTLTYWQITPRKYQRHEDQQLEQIRTTQRYGPYEKEYIHKAGHLVPVRLNGVVVEIEGDKYIWSQVENLTEEKYRKLFQHAVPPLALCEVDGTLLLVNKSYAELLGRTVDDILGRSFWHFTPSQFDVREKKIQEDLKEKGQFSGYSTNYRNRSGEEVEVTLYGLLVEIHQHQYMLCFVEMGHLEEITVERPFEWRELSDGNDPDLNRPIAE